MKSARIALALMAMSCLLAQANDTLTLSPTKLTPQKLQKVAEQESVRSLITNKANIDKTTREQFTKIKSRALTIKRPKASFIQVHFAKLQLPPGVFVEVSNADGTQVHVYGKSSSSLFTLRDGDDGVHSFAALSIFGDTAIIKVKGNSKTKQDYHVEVDSIMRGFNEDDFLFNSMPEPQSTCGVNQRTDVQCWADSHPIEYERSRPVARLLINGSASCTAWRVGPDNRMFTNNHCISSATGPGKTEVWFNYQRTGCGSGSTPGRVIVTGDELLATSADHDFTLFTLKNFAQVSEFGYYGLDVRDPIALERIYIPQHGRGQPKQLSIEDDQNSENLCRVDVVLADGSAPNTDMGYQCDTIGGSSGSPVLAASSNKAIALHHFGGCPNQGVLINQIWPQVATHFNNQIPDGDNGNQNPGEPVASFTFVANQLSVEFTSTSQDSNGSIERFSWQFGDGNSSNQENPQHSYASAGTYSVTLRVTDNDGLSASYSSEVTVSDGSEFELQKGVAKTNLAASQSDTLSYYFDLTEAASVLTFDISGGSGDADIYLRFGQEPTTSSYDCRPYKSGNTEQCRYTNAAPGRYYVMIRAYRSFSGLALVADYATGSDRVSFEESNLSASTGEWHYFTLEVPAGATELLGTISGGSGDADLYVRYGAAPTTSAYDCRPYKSGNSETCQFSNPSSGTWHFAVRAYRSFSGVTISGSAQ